MRTIHNCIALAILLAALSGCGTKGPLYLPQQGTAGFQSTR